MSDQEEKKGPAEEVRAEVNAYVKYSTLGIQMLAVIVAFVLGGRWLDRHLHWKFPAFTVLGVFLGIAGAFWFLFKETRKER